MPDGFRFAVATSAPELKKAFGDFARKQLPFATAVSLTHLARESQERVQVEMTGRFKLHGTRLQQGVRIKPADKRDWPNLRAIVGDKDEFMVRQETGGEKRAQKGASQVAIPVAMVAKLKGPTGRPPRRLVPKVIMNQSGIYERPGDAIVASPRRAEKLLGNERKAALRLWFVRSSVRIKPRFKFRETVVDEAQHRYAAIFERNLTAAVKSARARNVKMASETARALWLKALRSVS